MEKINDIEAIIPSQIEHYFNFLILIIVGMALLIFLILWRVLRKRKATKKHPFESLDFNKIDKDLLYNFTLIAKKLPPKEGLEELLEKLEPYKYKRESEPIDEVLIEEIREYIKRCQE